LEHKRLNELLSEAKKRNEDLKYGKDEVLSVSGELGIVNQIEHLGRSYAGVSVHQYHVVEVGDIVYTKSPLKANPFGIIKLNKGKAGIVSTLYAVYKVNQQTCLRTFYRLLLFVRCQYQPLFATIGEERCKKRYED
jgi:type I restriction enzyme S subunit